MSIRLRRPQPASLAALADESRVAQLTYAPVGISALADAPDGYHLDRWSCLLGRGDRVFDAAVHTLRHWGVHRGAGIVVLASEPPRFGLVVAMSAPLPVGFIDLVCRVVEVVDTNGCFGFTYGTLPVHPEQGEESFTVTRHADDDITFEIAAASRPRNPLARACPPVARRLQRSATMRYLDAMKVAVAP